MQLLQHVRTPDGKLGTLLSIGLHRARVRFADGIRFVPAHSLRRGCNRRSWRGPDERISRLAKANGVTYRFAERVLAAVPAR